MITLGVWENPESVGVGDSLLIALIAIVIVFSILLIIIGTTTAFQKSMEVISAKTSIHPRKENKILETDEDAVVAVLAATIDFHKETGKEPRVLSVQRIED